MRRLPERPQLATGAFCFVRPPTWSGFILISDAFRLSQPADRTLVQSQVVMLARVADAPFLQQFCASQPLVYASFLGPAEGRSLRPFVKVRGAGSLLAGNAPPPRGRKLPGLPATRHPRPLRDRLQTRSPLQYPQEQDARRESRTRPSNFQRGRGRYETDRKRKPMPDPTLCPASFHAEAGSYDRPRLLKQSASPARSVRRVLIVPSLRGQNDHDEHRKDH